MPIQIIDGFNLGASKPIDSRIVASGSTARDQIKYKYDGLLVVDTKDYKPYIWNVTLGTWSSVSSGSSNINGVPSEDIYTTGDKTYVGKTANIYIGGNNLTKNVFIGDDLNKSNLNVTDSLNVSTNLNVTGTINGNGSNITSINPSNISVGVGVEGNVLQLNSSKIPTWTKSNSTSIKSTLFTTSVKNYNFGFLESSNISGNLSNIFYQSGIGLEGTFTSTAHTGTIFYLNGIGLSASMVGITDLNVSRAGTFSRAFATSLNVTNGTFSRAGITDLDVSRAGTFSRAGITDLDVSRAGTFSRAFATSLNVTNGTFSRAFTTDLNVTNGTFSRAGITDLDVSRAGTFSRAFATSLNVTNGTFSRAFATSLNVTNGTFSRVFTTDIIASNGTFSRASIHTLNTSGISKFKGDVSLIGEVVNRFVVTFPANTGATSYWLKPTVVRVMGTGLPTTNNIFQAFSTDHILYIYGSTIDKSFTVDIYVEYLSSDKSYIDISPFSASSTETSFRASTISTDILYNYMLLHRQTNDGGQASINCIIPSGRKFLIKAASATTSISLHTMVFTFMKFGSGIAGSYT
jgi:hypothetical protein